MREAFIDPRVSGKVMQMIELAGGILEEYRAKGFVMTLRMLHYQFVSRYPKYYPNTLQSYKRLGHALKVGRLAGIIDWDDLEDSIRELTAIPTWGEPAVIIESAANQYREAFWENQDYAPELWIEKDAIARVIAPAANELRIPVFACRGYVSQSSQYQASKRFLNAIANDRTPIVFYMGDHDPSGLDMPRNNMDQFELLTDEPVEVRYVALTMDQIKQYGPPPNYAKPKDSRYPAYRRKFGVHSWELDALPPDVLNELVRTNVRPLIDTKRWQESLDRETTNRERLTMIVERYDDIIRYLENDYVLAVPETPKRWWAINEDE